MKKNNPLEIKLLNSKLSSPLILGSGTLVEKIEDLDPFLKTTIGAVVPRTTRIEMIRKIHPSPHLYQFGNNGNEMMLNAEWTGAAIDYWLPYLEQMSKTNKVIMSVSGRDIDGCVKVCKILDKYNFPMLEINLSCAHSNNVHGFITRNSKHIESIVRQLKDNIKTPIGIKLGHSEFIVELASVAKKAGSDAIIAINTFGPIFDFKIEDNLKIKPVVGIQNAKGGLSGGLLFNIALTDIADISRQVKIPVIGCGGVNNAEQVVKMMMAGASAVQIYTAAHVRGVNSSSIFDEINRDLLLFIKKHKLNNIFEIKDKALFLLDQETNLKIIYPEFKIEKCSSCGSCVRICLKKALQIKNKKIILNRNLCDGCGHCTSICPNKAIY